MGPVYPVGAGSPGLPLAAFRQGLPGGGTPVSRPLAKSIPPPEHRGTGRPFPHRRPALRQPRAMLAPGFPLPHAPDPGPRKALSWRGYTLRDRWTGFLVMHRIAQLGRETVACHGLGRLCHQPPRVRRRVSPPGRWSVAGVEAPDPVSGPAGRRQDMLNRLRHAGTGGHRDRALWPRGPSAPAKAAASTGSPTGGALSPAGIRRTRLRVLCRRQHRPNGSWELAHGPDN